MLLYTYSKSIDNDSLLGGQGPVSSASQSSLSQAETLTLSTSPAPTSAIAQDWLNLRAERSLSSFDQRHLLNVQAQYTSGQGLEGGTLLGGWPGRLLKEWTLLTQITAGTGLPQTPVYPAVVPGTGWSDTLRPSLTGAPLYNAGGSSHLNANAYTAPAAGAWGDAGRNSITGPNTFSLDGALQRTFRPSGSLYLDARVDATNVLNHPVFTSWNTTFGNARFGEPCRGQPDAQRAVHHEAEVLMMRDLISLLLAAAFAVSSSAQQTGQNKDPHVQSDFTLSMKVQLVVETVAVKDKQGNPVHGLTAKDFAVTEDGVPQTISFCEHQDLANAMPLEQSQSAEENLKIYKRLARTQIAPSRSMTGATGAGGCWCSISICRRCGPLTSCAHLMRPCSLSGHR